MCQYQVENLAYLPKLSAQRAFIVSPNLYFTLKTFEIITFCTLLNFPRFGITSIGMENFLFPDEIVLKIFGYLGLGELIQCSKVSKRFNTICKDNSLGYRSSMLIMKDLMVEIRNI